MSERSDFCLQVQSKERSKSSRGCVPGKNLGARSPELAWPESAENEQLKRSLRRSAVRVTHVYIKKMDAIHR